MQLSYSTFSEFQLKILRKKLNLNRPNLYFSLLSFSLFPHSSLLCAGRAEAASHAQARPRAFPNRAPRLAVGMPRHRSSQPLLTHHAVTTLAAARHGDDASRRAVSCASSPPPLCPRPFLACVLISPSSSLSTQHPDPYPSCSRATSPSRPWRRRHGFHAEIPPPPSLGSNRPRERLHLAPTELPSPATSIHGRRSAAVPDQSLRRPPFSADPPPPALSRRVKTTGR